jgi:hypothetical protein
MPSLIAFAEWANGCREASTTLQFLRDCSGLPSYRFHCFFSG